MSSLDRKPTDSKNVSKALLAALLRYIQLNNFHYEILFMLQFSQNHKLIETLDNFIKNSLGNKKEIQAMRLKILLQGSVVNQVKIRQKKTFSKVLTSLKKIQT